LLTALQPSNNLVINAMQLGGEVLVGELRSAVVDDDIAIGSVANRCLLSEIRQTSHFKGVRTVFDPERTLRLFTIRRSFCVQKGPLGPKPSGANLRSDAI
jgi:hypothetical protein